MKSTNARIREQARTRADTHKTSAQKKSRISNKFKPNSKLLSAYMLKSIILGEKKYHEKIVTNETYGD